MKILNNLVLGLLAFAGIGFGGNEGPHGGN